MNQSIKRVLSLALVLVMILSFSAPAFAAGNITYREGKATLYLDVPTGKVSEIGIGIAWGDKNFTINRADVKVKAGTSDLRLVGFRKEYNTRRYDYDPESSNNWGVAENYKYCHYNVKVACTKPGTGTLTYKVGTKTYKINIVVEPYKNHVKTLTITGLNSGRNLASLTKNQVFPSKNLTLSQTTKSVKAQLTANSGWLVTRMEIYDLTANTSRILINNKGASSMTLACGTLNVKHNYQLFVAYRSTDGSFTTNMNYYIHGAKAS